MDFRDETKWKVYVHTSPSGKMYVGITSRDVRQRWQNGRGYIKNDHFYRAIQKYGWNKFEHEVIAENLTKDEACEMEKKLIKELKSNDYHFGYNISSGGEGGASGCPSSELQKKVTSERMKKAWRDPQYREKMINFSKQRMNDPNYVKRISEKNKLLWEDHGYRAAHSGENHWCYGRKRESLYEVENYNARPIVCVNTGEKFGCMIYAMKKYNISRDAISRCCNNHTTHGGQDTDGNNLLWMFEKDFNNISPNDLKYKLYLAKKGGKNAVINTDNHELFSSSKQAANKYQIKNPCSISYLCSRKDKKRRVANHHWMYLSEYIEINNCTEREAFESLFFIA